MTAGVYDVTVEQGATFRLEAVYKDSAGAVVDLTGYTARMQIRKKKSSTTTLSDSTTANGEIVITAAAGKVVVEVPAATTALFGDRRAFYDLEIESSTGFVTRLLEGCVTITKEVTR